MVRRHSPITPVALRSAAHCSIPEQRKLLGQSPYLTGLTEDEVNQVQRTFQQQHYDAGDFIQKAGEPAIRLSIVGAGFVKVVRPTMDGQDVLLDILGPGEHFGSLAELGDASYREDVVALTDCCILYTNADNFHEILQRFPAVALSTLELVAARLRGAQSSIEHLSAYPVDRRVSSTLLHLAAKIGRVHETGFLIDVPLSRQDIADMTGAKVETVSRVLSDFRRRGLIASGRRWIAVIDREGLADIAGSDMP